MESFPFPYEVMHAFVFPESTADLAALLEQHEGLDEYVVPVISLMHAIQMLSAIDGVSPAEPDEEVIELFNTRDGGIAAQPAPMGERDPGGYVPLIVSVARSGPQFLNEKGYRLLTVLAQGEQDPGWRQKTSRYAKALQICLDQGLDEQWLVQQGEMEQSQENDPIARGFSQGWKEYFQMRDLLLVENAAGLENLLAASPWMKVYSTGIPIDFVTHPPQLLHALGQFSWGKDWVMRWRALKACPELLGDPVQRILQRILEIAQEHSSEDLVHDLIANRVPDNLALLKRCGAKGCDQVMLDLAGNYVVGV
jgi:hypothetical protein